jgi:hypothetical protein
MKKHLFFLIFFLFCQKRNLWEDDKELVDQFIKNNKNIFSILSFLEKKETNFSYSSFLFPFDTIYQNQKLFEKIAHIYSFYRLTYDTFSLFNLKFFVENKDTFCQVDYLDSIRHIIALIKYDSLWQIFFSESLKVDSIKKIFQKKEYEKIYPIYLHKNFLLKKVGQNYLFYQIPFANFYYPHSDSIPKFDLIYLNEHQFDTTILKKALLLEELPHFSFGESLIIRIKLKDTLNEGVVFLHYQNKRFLFDKNDDLFFIKIRLEKTGIDYLTIEILTHKTLFYFKEKFIYNLIQIPIIVENKM